MANNTNEGFDLSKFDPNLSAKATEIMKILDDNIFYISNYNETQYDELIDTLIRNMAEGFEHEEFRHHLVYYKFNKDDKDEDVKCLKFNHFIVNILFWRPAICLNPEMFNDSMIITEAMMGKLNQGFIKNYMDTHYTFTYNRHIPTMPNLQVWEINRILNEIMCDTTFQLSKISAVFPMFIGISSGIEVFIDLAKRFPEFDKLLHYTVDETLQPAEIEGAIEGARKDFFNIINLDDRPNMLKPLIQPSSGLKDRQVSDMAINIALKPDEDGKTISHPINTNYLAGGGLKTTWDYYVNAISGRKAAIINNEFMGKSGHLLILISIATAQATLSKTTLDCNTVNPIPIEIKTEDHLKRLNGRRYRYPGTKEYHILDSRKDKKLIGQTLNFRSPITCACKDGICRECYGDLYYTNIDLENAGIYSATIYMNPVVQGILSAKHHQTTNSSIISFRPEFGQFFNMSSTDIILADDIDEILSYSLLIRREWIQVTDGEDDELDFSKISKKKRKKKKNTEKFSDNVHDIDISDGDDDDDDDFELGLPYYTTKFEVVKNLKSKKKAHVEHILFQDHEEKELFMHTDFVSKMLAGSDEDGQYLYIDLSDINPEEFIFVVDVENNELTKPMKSIQKVLNNKEHEGCDSYEELVNKLIDLAISSKLSANSIHSEMIVRQLVVDKDNVLKRPNFERIIMRQDYQLLTISIALKKNPSITTSLSTPYLKAQLIDLGETFEKSGAGVLDPLFMRTLSSKA